MTNETIVRTAVLSCPLPMHRNMFRFDVAQSQSRLRVQVGLKYETPEQWTDILCVPEADFDFFDITVAGRPVKFWVVAPGLCAAWPTADDDYQVHVSVGASDDASAVEVAS